MKTTNLTIIFCVLFVSYQLTSCQKDQSGTMVNANSVDNGGIRKLPVDSTLVAWYPFTNGELGDKSGHHNKIIFCSATPTVAKNGKDSDAYYFDGTSSYMQVKNRPSLNPSQAITLAALIKPMGFYQGQCHGNRILNKEYSDATDGRYLLGYDDQKFYNYTGCDQPVKENHENFYGTYGNGQAAASGATDTANVRPGKWYNIVYTYGNGVSNLYINNKLVMSAAVSTSFTPNTYDLLIGKSLNPPFPYYFTGVIDEIRIYNRALSSSEITGLSGLMGEDN